MPRPAHRRLPDVHPHFGQFSLQFLAEGVVVHLHRVALATVKSEVRVFNLLPYSDLHVSRACVAPLNLQAGNARLVVGQWPDAAQRLEQSNEKQRGVVGVHRRDGC